ncbi:MAG: PEP-CTERM sorting domain-containing protein [Acidibrevibacterium sp.]|uniref:PEP-CTERM sorting domain-containing protein n=1 Tax=Acidibrevibacterium sp. TaxID=2606776 RepID=UPI003D07E104
MSGSDLFVTNPRANTIGEYNATTGAVIDASPVTGLDGPQYLAVADTSSAVPEPASLSLFAVGALGFAALRRGVSQPPGTRHGG